MMSQSELTQSIKSEALRVGFDWCGVCPAVSPPGYSRFEQWLRSGYHGQMEYLSTRRSAYADPGHVMEGARSIVMLALGYQTAEPTRPPAGSGRVSRYAWGPLDYHDVIHARLKQLKQSIVASSPEVQVRGVVDTAPLLEREFAVLAGLGWQGKNTLILNKQAGSWFFLAALLIDQDLDPDQPHVTEHCGTCTACLEACPTDAFVQPNLLDASRCISYLTIELKEPIPVELRSGIGDWLFGCDVCQDVCPWNRKPTATMAVEFQPTPHSNPVDLMELFELDEEQFRERFRKTPLWRPRRRGILRNAAIVLGNQKLAAAVPALIRGLHDTEPLVRGACIWALNQIGTREAREAVLQRSRIEQDPMVLFEFQE